MATIAERINRAKQDTGKATGNASPKPTIEDRIRLAKQNNGKAGTSGVQSTSPVAPPTATTPVQVAPLAGQAAPVTQSAPQSRAEIERRMQLAGDMMRTANQRITGYSRAGNMGAALEEERSRYASAQAEYQNLQQMLAQLDQSEKKKYSLGKGLAGVAQKGLSQIAQAGGATLAFAEDVISAPFELISGQRLGDLSNTGPLNRWNDAIKREAQAVNDYYAENVEAGGKTAELFDRYGAGAIAALPQAIAAWLTSGASVAAQSTAGLSQVATAASNPGIRSTLLNMVQSSANNPQYWLSFANTVGSDYEEALADGVSPETAALYAIGSSLLNAEIEVGGGIQTLPDELKQGKGGLLRLLRDAAVDEGKEEVEQGIVSRTVQNLIYGKDNPVFSTTDPNAILNPYTAADEFAGGAFAGGLLGGGQIGLSSAGQALYNAAAKRPQAQQENTREIQNDASEAETTQPPAVTPSTPAVGDDVTTAAGADIAGQLVAAGATQAEAETLAPLLSAVLNGEEISGNQAGTIAKNEVAVSILENATGETINTDAPLGEVKTTIRGLASRHSAQVEQTATEDTPAQVQPVEAAQAPVESPVMESPAVEDFTQRNAQAVSDFAKTVDKAGATVLTQMYSEGQDTEQYIAGMMRAYNAGKNGTSRAEIINDLQGINAAQAQAAYIAGQEDSARAEQAAFFGKNAGVVKDDMLKKANLSSKDRRMLNAVGKVAGVKVRFVSELTDESGRPANAQYKNGELLIALNTADPVRVAFTHEIVHRMREVSPEAYNALATFVQQNMNSDSMAVVQRAYSDAYGTNPDVLSEEIVAQAIGQMMSDSAVLEQFVKDDRNAAQKLSDAVHDLIAAIKRVLNGQNVKLTAEQKADFADLQANLEGMSKALENALKRMEEDVQRNTEEGNKNTASEGGEVKRSIKRSNGSRVVWFDTDITKSKSPNEKYTEFVSEFLSNYISENGDYLATLSDSEKKVYAHENLPNEFSDSAYTKFLRNKKQDRFYSKMRAAGSLAELVEIATGRKWEKGKHHHNKDVKYGVYKYKSKFAFPSKDSGGNITAVHAFDCTLVVINASDGNKYLYDIIGIKEDTVTAADLFKKEVRKMQASQPKGVSVDSISLNGEKSNPQNLDSKNSLVVARSKAAESLGRELASIREEGARTGKDAAEIELEVQQAIERSYESLVDEYGAIQTGESPAREVQVPKRTADNQKVSQTVRTILEAKATPDVAVPTIEELTANGDFSYEVYTDKQAMADAENTIRDKGYNSALMDWTKSVQEGEVSKGNTALGWALYNQAANAGDLKTAMSILTNMVGHQRNAAQAVQATRILKKMSPEAQLYGVQRSAQNLAEELEKRYGKDAPDIRVNEELARKYLEAETDKEREEAMRNLYRDLGRQMPSRFIDKWNAWRYLAMLCNAPTHMRNIGGNAGFAPVVLIKDLTATAIEAAVSRVSGGKLERTKGMVGVDRKSRELLSAAWTDYESVADQVSGGGKYSDLDHANQYIQEGRRIFKNRALEVARKGNSAALEAEDMWFSRPHYAYALAQYCKAHGISPEMLRVANEGQKNNATRGGEVRYSVKGNPYAGKNLSDDPSVYTWDFLTSLPDMKTVTLPEVPSIRDESGRVDTSKVVTAGMRNARNVGTEQDGKVFVRNTYTGKNLMVTTNSIRHGLNGANNRLLTNARLGAVIGEVVKNAVPINALNDKAADVIGTYAMASYATDSKGREFVAIVTVEQKSGRIAAVEAYDMLHAVSGRQKKSSQADTKSQSKNSIKAAIISIADLLKIVKETHQSILSGDVLAHFGEERSPNGDYAGKVKFSLATAERPALQTKAPFIDRVLLDRARAYAIKEAQKATYRDTNAFSQTISELGRYRGNNKVKKGVGVALEGILPFRKTPANILVRGLEYSPLGLANGIKQAVLDVKRGTKTAAEAIDSVSAGLTGTGLLALGAFLAAQGLVRGSGGDDEDKNEFEEIQGHQAYALELPDGTSVTLDWLAPEVLPFFVGVNLWEQTASKGDGGVTMSDILTATANVTEPLLEMSCLQSLNDVFDAVGYASSDGLSALPSALASAATSYLTQGFPTILGQAERTGEDKRMTTYTEKNAFLTPDMQYTVGRISARLPGWDYQQIPYIDAWGRTENTGNAAERAGNNFLNPAYTSTVETSPMEDELLRLYEQTGDGSVLPSRAAKYFNVDGKRKDLTAQEYVKYATAKGQTAYKVLTALSGTVAYRAMSDSEKAEAVGLVYDYANATAKTKVSSYKPEGWIAKAVKTEKATGVKAEQYVTLYLAQKGIESLKEADGDTIANSKSLLVMEMVYNVKGLTDTQRRALFEDFGVGKTVIHFNKAAVQEKLKAMR